MKVYLASDHAGFILKEKVLSFLKTKGYDIVDCGAYEFNSSDDYPDFISAAASAVSKSPTDKAVIFGGSGQAEAMLANKYPRVRAALFYTPKLAPEAVDVTGRKSTDPYEMIRLTREHNDANVLSIGGRFVTPEEAFYAIDMWLSTAFSEAERHKRRLEKIKKIEEEIHG